MTENTEIVPRRLDLAPTLESHLEQARTQHQAFAPLHPPLPEWRSYAAQRHIQAMALDPARACLWLATWGGVLCWEPQTHRCIRHTSAHGLSGNATRSLVVDNTGVVWAAGQHTGLSSLTETAGWQTHRDLETRAVLRLTPRPDGGIYLALRDAEGQCTLAELTAPDAHPRPLATKGLAIKDPDALWVGADKRLWIGNPWGLHCYHDGTIESFDMNGAQVRAIAPGRNGELWMGTLRGLYRFTAGQEPSQAEGWPRDMVLSLAIEPDTGDLWALTTREVGRLYGDVWQPSVHLPSEPLTGLLTASQALKDATPESLLCLPEGHVWAAGANGLYKVSLGGYEPVLGFTPEDDLSNAVQSLWADDAGVWMGAARGLYHFDGQFWRGYAADLPQVRDVRAIAPGKSQGQVWIGSWQAGLHALEQGVYAFNHPLTQPMVGLAAGADGSVWAATPDTVYWQPPGSPTWQPLPQPLPREMIRGGIIQTLCHQMAASSEDPVSTLWVGATTGLFFYRPALELWDWVRGDLEKLPIQALALDPLTNHLWVGTPAGVFSEPAWNCRREVHALTLAFSPAPAGTLWIGTPSGLEAWPAPGADASFNGQPLHSFTSANSGLAADKVTALAIRQVAGQEEVWIGSPNGVSRYQVAGSKEQGEEHDNDLGH